LASAGTASAQETVTIAVGDIWFCAEAFENGVCDTTVTAGDTVVWEFSAAQVVHTVTECGTTCDSPTLTPLFDSGMINGGAGPYSYRFTEPGTFLYYCEIHPLQQRGRIIVRQAPAATATSPSVSGGGTNTPAPATTPGVRGGDSLPPTGFGPSSDGGPGRSVLAVAAAGAFLAVSGGAAYALAARHSRRPR
jgi:plastocyanin